MIFTLGCVGVVSVCVSSNISDSAKVYVKFDEQTTETLPLDVVSNKSLRLFNDAKSLGEVCHDDLLGASRSFEDAQGAKAQRLVTTTKMPVYGTAARTYSIWVKMESFNKYPSKNGIDFQNKPQIITTGSMQSEGGQLTFTIYSRRHVMLSSGNLSQVEFNGGYTFLDKEWNHFVIVINEGGRSSEVQCYVNGEEMTDRKSYNGDKVMESDFIFNTASAPMVFGQNFNGQLSRFILFDRAITKDEVQQVYTNKWRADEVNFSVAAKRLSDKYNADHAKEVARWKNPFIKHMFTADPSGRVFNGRMYVYASHDVDPSSNCGRMDKYHVFSSKNMKRWRDHGEILSSKDVAWGRKEGGLMWAPDCVYRNGRYYFYFPHPSETNFKDSWKIGVAVSDRPDGGFDASPETIGVAGFKGYIEGMKSFIDPNIFIDDDGRAYIYQGGSGICYGGKLKENMVELDGEMQLMYDTEGSTHKYKQVEYKTLKTFHEGTWVFKRGNVYYLTCPDNTPLKDGGNQMIYFTSDNPLGPWDYRGVFHNGTGCGTSHGSVVEYKGEWYLFYHNRRLSGIVSSRSICVDKLYFNEDGTIKVVEQTF